MIYPTPERILDAALSLYAAGGPAAMTTTEICRHAAVSNGSLFHHFGSIAGVAAALHLRGIQAYQDALRAALRKAGGDPRRGVAAAIAAHQGWAEAEPALARFLFDRGRQDRGDDHAAEIAAANTGFLADLRDWAAPHVAAGSLRDLPVEVIGAQLIGPIQMFTRAWLAGRREKPPGRDPDFPLPALQAAAWRALRGPAQPKDTDND